MIPAKRLPMAPKTVQLYEACAITHFTIAAWVDSWFKLIAAPFVNKNGSFSGLENNATAENKSLLITSLIHFTFHKSTLFNT